MSQVDVEAHSRIEELRDALDAQEVDSRSQILIKKPMSTDPFKGWRALPIDDPFSLSFGNAILAKLTSELANRSLVGIDYDALALTTLGAVNLENFGILNDFVEDLPTAFDSPQWNGDFDYINKSKVKCVRFLGPNDDELLAFSTRGSGRTLKKVGLAIFNLEKEQLEEVSEQVIEFQENVDFFVWRGWMFVLNEKALASATNFAKVIDDRAHKAIDKLSSYEGLEIAKIEEIRDIVNTKRGFARKLAATDAAGVFDSIDLERVKKTVDDYGVKCTATLKDGNLKLDPDLSTHESRTDFIDLLGDNLVEGARSGKQYKAIKKAPRK